MVYFAHMQSHLQYGVVLWGGSPHAKRLFILQKKAIRFMARASHDPCADVFYKDSCRPLFRTFNILTLPCLYILCSVLYIHQNKHLFIQSTGRSPGLLTRLVPKISRGPLNEGRILYNALPHVIRNKKDDFHNYVKNYLMDNCFYSVEEFLNCK
jgi:hypothetical protein